MSKVILFLLMFADLFLAVAAQAWYSQLLLVFGFLSFLMVMINVMVEEQVHKSIEFLVTGENK